MLGGTQQQRVPQLMALFPASLVRGLFSARKAVANPQIHTHDKYKTEYPQPTHDFLLGRFVVDRNGTVWHRQANYRHQRHDKTASQLTRLKRWKPLYSAFASKLKKVGFKERYWAPPDATDVPGFEPRFKAPLKRRSAVPALNQTTGDPALRQSYKPGPRQRLR
ncbi:hypothetical protein HYH03_010708 [Edaphochlamys debaryana]|uniref:Uncharacterized protein n=1 Tax=Edaphochlamys debaryana TaxID=47281 RepID=A0A835XVA6_9CHLO|nr:hypothetical protein HYH03_010708 [Edaphochlamys debaryana]|eukprot:KAG2490786.1 hypothetical protein HYH03_010708 [Edaphochlamys debaryana]